MKKIFVPILVMVFVFSLAWIVGAQSSRSDQPGSSQQYGGGKSEQSGTDQSGTSQQYKGKEPQETSQHSNTGKMHKASHEKSMEDYKASKWIGTKVENRQGENLGKIEDLVLNSKGQVDFVILSHGGALGIGEKYTAVPFRSFSRKDDKTLVLNISKEKMADAPNFDKDNWPDMTNRKWSEHVYRYYGQKPYWSESSQKSTQHPNRTEQKKKIE